jgi:hypothetical protein
MKESGNRDQGSCKKSGAILKLEQQIIFPNVR